MISKTTKGRLKDIDLNATQFPVRENLWWFLYRIYMQQLDPEASTFFWIDAICIDQHNSEERNHQVQMMRAIYSNAQSVTVWLGPGDESSDVAMRYLATKRPPSPDITRFRKRWSNHYGKALLAMCDKRYWRRMWIVQKVLLAKRTRICCVTKTVSWVHFEQLVKDIQALSQGGRDHNTFLAPYVCASPAFAIATTKLVWDGRRRPLTELFQRYCDHEATDVRDKAYALFGLARDIAGWIPIDYSLSPKTLFLEVLYHATIYGWPSEDHHETLMSLLGQYAKIVADALRVHCGDKETGFHLSIGLSRRGNPCPPHSVHVPCRRCSSREDLDSLESNMIIRTSCLDRPFLIQGWFGQSKSRD